MYQVNVCANNDVKLTFWTIPQNGGPLHSALYRAQVHSLEQSPCVLLYSSSPDKSPSLNHHSTGSLPHHHVAPQGIQLGQGMTAWFLVRHGSQLAELNLGFMGVKPLVPSGQ